MQTERIAAFKESIMNVIIGGHPQTQHEAAMPDDAFDAFQTGLNH